MNKNKTTKKCTRCQEYRPLILMVKNKQSVDGLASICLACKREKNKQHKASCKNTNHNERKEYCGSWLGDNALYL